MNDEERDGGPRPRPAPPGPPARLRSSDADRVRAAEQLHEHAAAGRLTMGELEQRLAAAYAARTVGELGQLMEDLPGQYQPADRGRPRLKRWFGALMGSSSRRLPFRLSRRAVSVAIMASPDIDLCAAEIDGGETVIHAFALFGWPDIYVPDSVRVEMTGFTLIGGDAEWGSARRPPPDAPVLKVRSYGLIGGYTVWRLPAELCGLPYDEARRAPRALPPDPG